MGSVDLFGHRESVPKDSFQRIGDVLANMDNYQFSERPESKYAHEKMQLLQVSFNDVGLHECIGGAIDRALSCNDTCTVNPINSLHKIREAFYELSDQGYIDSDNISQFVARMMSNAGEDFQSRTDVVNKLSNKDFSPIGI